MRRDYKAIYYTIIIFFLSFLFFLFSENHFIFHSISDGDSPSSPKSPSSSAPVSENKTPVPDSLSPADTLSSSPLRILIAGDSMCEGLFRRLNDYCSYNNHNLNAVIWSSSSIVGWSARDTLKHYINKYKANYILFVIGSNELFTPNSVARERNIKKIEQQMAGIPSIWIGPPNWKKDNGINDLIKSIVGEDRFFPSLNLSFQRLNDGAHPTIQSAYAWMDSIASWIQTKSRFPIPLKVPLSHSNTQRSITYLSVPKTSSPRDSLGQLTAGTKRQIDTITVPQAETQLNPSTETKSPDNLPK